MMSLSVSNLILCIIISCINIASSYWLSQNRLSWANASSYCQNRCNSDLISIHSNADYYETKYLIKNTSAVNQGFDIGTDNVWIGLNKLSGSWEWSNSQPYDYGTDTATKGTFPWAPGEPNNAGGDEYCIEHDVGNNYLWNTAKCVSERRFLCDSCEGLLDKYILYRAASTYTVALDFCENTLGTSLASIHSSDDMDEAKYLCDTVDAECWIGLDRINDPGMSWSFSMFEWTDDTVFDYGYYNVGRGTYPWALNEPNNAGFNEYCVEMDLGAFRWNDEPCDYMNYFLCNKPNELCDKYAWKPMYIPHSDIMFEGCSAKSVNYGPAVISNKRWNDDNWPLNIHYTFSVHNKNNIGNGEVGITVYHMATAVLSYDICDYYFLGLQIDDNDIAHITWDIYRNGNIDYRQQPSESTFVMKYDRYYQLEVELVNDYNAQTMNEITFTWSISTDGFIFGGAFNDGASDAYQYTVSEKYIGITNKNTNITAKSLYISGTPQYDFGPTTLNQCTLPPTNNPTSDPTTDPTKDPTDDPTNDPTTNPINNPSISPTTVQPTRNPTKSPSNNPTDNPSISPSDNPSISPTTATPTLFPTTAIPTATYSPTIDPTKSPSTNPSINPSINPTITPSDDPSNIATLTSTKQNNDERDGSVDITTTDTKTDGINSNGDSLNTQDVMVYVYIIVALIVLCIIIVVLFVFMKKKNNSLKKEIEVVNNIQIITPTSEHANTTTTVYVSDVDIDDAGDTGTKSTNSDGIGMSAFGETPGNFMMNNNGEMNEGVSGNGVVIDHAEESDDDELYNTDNNAVTPMGITDDGNGNNDDLINGFETTVGR